MHCLICGSEMNDCNCPDCGFDLSRCAELYPTFSATDRVEPALWTVRSDCYQKLSARARVLEKRVKELENKLSAGGTQAAAFAGQTHMPSGKKWECECGCRNSMSQRYCTNCGNIAPFVADDPTKVPIRTSVLQPVRKGSGPDQNRRWECDCGCRNPIGIRYCKNCGRTKPQ